MADLLAAALATDGLTWLLASIFLAGLVYGFAGFGAALLFHPLATVVVPPPVSVAILSVTSLGGAAVTFPGALRKADLRQVGWILGPAVVTLPAGAWVLVHADPDPLRWAICALVAATLAALMGGWRRQVAATPRALSAVGAGAGGIGGATGLLGPVIILFTLSGRETPEVMRANMILVLSSLGIGTLPALALLGHLPLPVVALGAVATPVYMAGIAVGQLAFDPARARLYRWLGYGAVAAAVLAGLPVWS